MAFQRLADSSPPPAHSQQIKVNADNQLRHVPTQVFKLAKEIPQGFITRIFAGLPTYEETALPIGPARPNYAHHRMTAK